MSRYRIVPNSSDYYPETRKWQIERKDWFAWKNLYTTFNTESEAEEYILKCLERDKFLATSPREYP